MRRFAWSVGVVMLILGGAIGVVLAVVWISILTHPDPGRLTVNFAIVTAFWSMWMVSGLALVRGSTGHQIHQPSKPR